MVKVIDDEFMVCDDCIPFITNNDLSHLDYHYCEDEAHQRELDIKNGLLEAGGHVCVGDWQRDDEFSTRPCDCCGSRLHGRRFHCVVLD